jgi:predicted ATPase
MVRATVLRRLGRLDRASRTILMQASAIGHRFMFEVAVTVTRRPDAVVRAALDGACDLELIVREGDSPEVFAFRHALMRDIIYGEFVDARVKPLHRRIVAALERQVPGRAALEDLAYHAWAAGDARRTALYGERAGDRAAALHAFADARTHYLRARSLLDVDSPAYARLSEKMDVGGGRNAAP